jgi:hypothetical protein
VKVKFQHKEGRGNLLKTKQKDGPKSPDLFGDACIGGRNYKIAGWKDVTKSGDPTIRLSFTAEDEQRTSKPDFDDALGI